MVSVIITTYNRKAFLRPAVFSVLKQDYRDTEVIIIDDGSTDGSFDEIKDLPLRYVYKENGGISSARNRGIEEAAGEYVAFLDVDDLWKKKKLSTQMNCMLSEGYDISYTDEIWFKNGRHLNQRSIHRKYSGYIFDKCLPLCIISPSSVVIRKNIFDAIGLFDENMPVCEDYDMWLRLTSVYPVLFVSEKLILKQGGHEDQLSKKFPAMDVYRIHSIARILDSDSLDNQNRAAAIAELQKKCRIYATGAEKRGKNVEAQIYVRLIEKYTIR
ncbi:MAG TPA: glycosyltransferase [Syntrophorhabdaceae bacterium]|nr:glycosyltransferase [Syntrophorhabdaceae bacterium]